MNRGGSGEGCRGENGKVSKAHPSAVGGGGGVLLTGTLVVLSVSVEK